MLRVHNLLVTLDGYATGDGQSLEAASATRRTSS
jgi:hypothetical protein